LSKTFDNAFSSGTVELKHGKKQPVLLPILGWNQHQVSDGSFNHGLAQFVQVCQVGAAG
jgi:hypothetical protein